MNRQLGTRHWLSVIGATALLAAGYSAVVLGEDATGADGSTLEVTLSGGEQVPEVTTEAAGTGVVTIGADHGITGTVTISGMQATAAHIHEAPAGSNGPPVVPLEQTTDGVWSVPANVTLTDAQYESFQAGNLYINVHSEAHPGGEIRAQLNP